VIDRCFSAESVPAILTRLDEDTVQGSEFAHKTSATIRAKSPTSLNIALEQMRRGKDLSFEAAIRTEFRIVSRIVEGHDFYEGVRATIIEKDGAPKWRPASLEAVDAQDVARHFADLGAAELRLP
jgi:enoyl-CoA hydratase